MTKLQFGRCVLSNRAQSHFGIIKHKTGITANISSRYALCLSLRDHSIPNPDEYDEGGTEINASVLFGDQDKLFMAVMLKRLEKDGLDPDKYLNKMVRAHINRGSTMLHARINSLADFYGMIESESGK